MQFSYHPLGGSTMLLGLLTLEVICPFVEHSQYVFQVFPLYLGCINYRLKKTGSVLNTVIRPVNLTDTFGTDHIHHLKKTRYIRFCNHQLYPSVHKTLPTAVDNVEKTTWQTFYIS